jgi:hypothetical protein
MIKARMALLAISIGCFIYAMTFVKNYMDEVKVQQEKLAPFISYVPTT